MSMERQPAVAGAFYPGDAELLRREVSELLGNERSDERAFAAIAPHAGYRYSGSIAADVYRRIRIPRAVIVLCPNHTGMGAREAIITSGAFHIPGHRIPIAEALARQLLIRAKLTDDALAHEKEHALEVHLPFLVARNPELTIVPICLGFASFADCVRIGEALADVIESHDDEILIVASTDMSHFLPANLAREKDSRALEPLEALDPEGLYSTVVENDISMCGVIPTTTALIAAKRLGAKSVTRIRYGNSGDVSGDHDRVVGYAGLIVQ
jgi:AmmeMemoRadiSam system protein B